MASSKINPDNRKSEETESDIPDFPSKIPGKLVSARRANTGKRNLHLVSSTPMNPAKKANFFDESNQFGSPIQSGGSSTDVNNSPVNKIKILESEQNTKKTMLSEEQTVGTSPFPFFTKLAVKKMTICASDEDSDDNIFINSSTKVTTTNNKLIIDTDEESSDSSDQVSEMNPKKTEAVIEFSRKDSTDKETSDEVEKILTKTAKVKLVDIKSNKNVLKTNEENKENINTNTIEIKSQPVKKNTKKEETDNNKDKPDLDSSKQRKLYQNTVQQKRNTKNKNENNIEVAINKPLTLKNSDTKRKIADKSMDGVRKSSRSCQSTLPYWMAPLNASDVKSTRSDDIGNDIMSVKGTKRPRTVPETVTKRKESTRVKAKSETTVILNKIETNPKSESSPKHNIKNDSIKENVKNITLNRSETKMKSEPKKKSIEEEVENITLRRTKAKSEPEKRNPRIELIEESVRPKTKSHEKKSTLIDEVLETTKNLNRSKTNEVEKKGKESHRIISKSRENDKNNTRLKETTSNLQDNKKRQYSKETDKESKEKKNKVENITSKLRTASPTKSKLNLRDSMLQSIFENEVFEPEIEEFDDMSSSLINTDSTVKKSSKRKNVHGLFKKPYDVSPPRTSRRIMEKNRRGTKNVEYTPGIALKQNKNESKSTRKKKLINTENKNDDKNLRAKRFSTRKLNRYVDELEENGEVRSEDLFNTESSNENGISQPRKKRRRVIEEKRNKATPGVNRKRAFKNTKQSSKFSKQVYFNVNESDMNNTLESDSLSSYENPSKVSCKASYNFRTNTPRQFQRFRGSRDSRYPRKTLFYKPERSDYRKSRHVVNDSTQDDSDSLSSEEMYEPKTKKRKSVYRDDYKKKKVDHHCYLNFKEKAIAAQVPISTHTRTEFQHRGKTLMMECFGNFPKIMSKINEQSSLRGTCFMNDLFAAGVMEITLGTIKKCNASNNHTYFVVLDGIAEIGIGDSAKILRIGDCCIVPKHTFYYVANASTDVNLLLNFLKISL